MNLLQDFIAPYVRVEDRAGRKVIGSVHGTAFFINDRGTFLTARHVVEACASDVAENGGQAALVIRDDRYPEARFAGAVTSKDFADAPYDVATGTVNRTSRGYFVFGDSTKAWVWEDVYTAGYPATATSLDLGSFVIDARDHKGHVLRSVKAGRFLMQPHPAVIEVSFAITKRMSGAPLVMRDQADAQGRRLPYFVLLGVCVGNEPSQIVDFSHSEVTDDGRELREETARIEEYGIVHDLRPLADWAPPCLNGETLTEAVQPDVR